MLAKSAYTKLTLDLIIPVLSFCLLVSGLIFVLTSPYFAITQITCTTDFEPCTNPSVVAELETLRGQNLFRVQTAGTLAKLRSANFVLRQASLTPIWPNQLDFVAFSTNPYVALYLPPQSTWVVFDDNWRFLRLSLADPNLPTVTVASLPKLTIGTELTLPHLRSALDLALKLSDAGHKPRSLALVDDFTVAAKLDSGLSVLFTTQKSAGEQVGALQSALAGDTIKSSTALTLDVRFAQPILRQN